MIVVVDESGSLIPGVTSLYCELTSQGAHLAGWFALIEFNRDMVCRNETVTSGQPT